MKAVSLSILLCIVVMAAGYSQQLDTAGLTAKVDSILATKPGEKSTGVAITLIREGKILLKKTYGLASIENEVPFTHETVVRLPYAETREFISVATIMMEEEGLLKLSDPVRKFFPKLPEWSSPVTIKDLLNHRSGFVDEWATLLLIQASMNNRFDKSQFLELLYNQPRPEVEPTKGYMYCNSDFGLLRLILEKVSTENLSKWMSGKLFAPLGMHHTRLHDNKNEAIPNFAMQYWKNGQGDFFRWTEDKTSPGGNYYVAMSASDLEKWDSVHKDSSSNIFRIMMRLKEDAQLMPGKGTNYVFGIKEKELNGYRIVSHQGVNDRPYLTYVPSLDLSIIALGNDSWKDYLQLHNNLLALFIGEQEKEPFKTFTASPVTYSPEILASFAGRYFDIDTVTYESFVVDRKNIFKFESDGQSLNLLYGNEPPLGLIPFAPNVFKDPDYDAYWEFIPTKIKGGPVLLNAYITQTRHIYHHKKDTTTLWKPQPKQLTEFQGKYYSKHLDFYWTLEINEDGKLIVKRPTIAPTEIFPETKDLFTMMVDKYPDNSFEVMVQFHRDKKGLITHLTVSHARLKGHQFDKLK